VPVFELSSTFEILFHLLVDDSGMGGGGGGSDTGGGGGEGEVYGRIWDRVAFTKVGGASVCLARITGEGGRVVSDEELDDVERFPFDACDPELELRAADHFEPTITGFFGAIVTVSDRGPVGTGFWRTCVDDVRADDGRIPRGFDVDPAGIHATAFGCGGGESLRPFTLKVVLDCLLEIGVGNDAWHSRLARDFSINLLLVGCIEARGICMERGPEGMDS